MSTTPDRAGLAALFTEAVGDTTAIAALARRIYPTEARLLAALVDPVAAADVASKYAHMRPPDDNDEAWVKVLRLDPSRTVVEVFAATGGDLADPDASPLMVREFPNGARKVAHFFKPEQTFYEVTCVAPGKDSGSRLHLFFWDGDDWCMGGPMWRILD